MVAVVEERAARGYREIVLLSLSCCALFFLIALVTFSSDDPGWSHSTSYKSVHNACGLFGAWLADFVLSFFGLTAYLLPIMLFWAGYSVYKTDALVYKGWSLLIKSSGFIATVLSGSAIFFLHLCFLRTKFKLDLPETPGGILGQEVGETLVRALGNSGSTLLLLAVFMTGVTLLTGLSWLEMMNRIGKFILSAGGLLVQGSTLRYREEQPVTELETKKPRSPDSAVAVDKSKVAEEKVKKSKPQIVAASAPVAPTLMPESDFQPLRKKDSHAVVDDLDPGMYINALPTLSLLDKREIKVKRYSKLELEELSRRVEAVLRDYSISADVESVHPGPVITRFEMRLAAGVKVSRISGLAKDLARGLSVTSVRIVEIIEGKSVIGLEIPNQEREMVSLRDLLISDEFDRAKSKLSIAMGKDISGTPVVADLGKMPHALVAGTTGSGKSVAINTMILSLLYKSKPADVRMIMIDPKMLELSVYEGIPHLLTPVVTDMKDAQNALRWAVAEMERRYKLMSKVGVRNLAGFNHAVNEAEAAGKPLRDPLFKPVTPVAAEDFPTLEALPSIVIVIDELADMMMVVGKKVEGIDRPVGAKSSGGGYSFNFGYPAAFR